MKADCPNCVHFLVDVEMQMKLGFCQHPNVRRPVTDYNARNCDGFGYERRGTFTVDAGDNGQRFRCDDCGVEHG